ncbi:MAG: YtxH domain-containing protein [Nitrospirota bacterium]|nr:YtxH domain-containing protein [Nitrospirota bacterium]
MEREEGNVEGLIVAFLGGVLIGAAAGLLLAPKSGRETRATLRDYAQQAEEELAEKVTRIKASIASCQQACEEHLKAHKEHARGPVT